MLEHCLRLVFASLTIYKRNQSASGGCRKVRWVRKGMGKSGGVRIIYFNRLENGAIYLMVIYAKAVRGSIPAHLLKAIKEALHHGR